MSETNISFPTEDGILQEISGQITVQWMIPKFFEKRYFRSKSFLFSDAEWFLEVYPSGDTRPDSQGWVCLFLHKKESPAAVHVDLVIRLKKMDGSVLKSGTLDVVFDNKQKAWGTNRIIKRAELYKSRNIVAPNGNVTFFCAARVRDFSSSTDGVPVFQNSSLNEVKDLKEKLRDLEETLSALKKENETFQKTTQEFEKGVLMLSQHFEELYLTGCQTDVVINVKDTQFNAHRSVLAARSTVFRAMFEVDMAEKCNSSVNIEEFESSVVDGFLKFLYSGKFDVISSSNAVGLYFMADKYNISELKEPCVECLTREISLESVFGTIHLARLHDEKKLLKTAKDYFLRNTYLIISSPQWLLFLEEYPAIANELFLEMVKSSANIE